MYDLGVLQPFLAGNDIALREFAAELARKNDLSLQWDANAAMADAMHQLRQEEQAANIRRIIMLTMDTIPARNVPVAAMSLSADGEAAVAGNLASMNVAWPNLIEALRCTFYFEILCEHPSRVSSSAQFSGLVAAIATTVVYLRRRITPRRRSAQESAQTLLDRADKLAWGNRWADAQPLYIAPSSVSQPA